MEKKLLLLRTRHTELQWAERERERERERALTIQIYKYTSAGVFKEHCCRGARFFAGGTQRKIDALAELDGHSD